MIPRACSMIALWKEHHRPVHLTSFTLFLVKKGIFSCWEKELCHSGREAEDSPSLPPPSGTAMPDIQGLHLGTEHSSAGPGRRSLDIPGHQSTSSSNFISAPSGQQSYQHHAQHMKLYRGKQAWEEGLSQDSCCIVNYSDNKSRKKVCLDPLSCRLLSWQLGRDICSAQPCAVGVDDHTFLMSILKLFLSRKISLALAPSESFGTKRLNSSEEPLRWGGAG